MSLACFHILVGPFGWSPQRKLLFYKRKRKKKTLKKLKGLHLVIGIEVKFRDRLRCSIALIVSRIVRLVCERHKRMYCLTESQENNNGSPSITSLRIFLITHYFLSLNPHVCFPMSVISTCFMLKKRLKPPNPCFIKERKKEKNPSVLPFYVAIHEQTVDYIAIWC